MSALLLVSVLLAVGEPCEAVTAADAHDAEAARAYAQIAEEELLAGAEKSALVALRQAVAHDPGADDLKQRLGELCRRTHSQETLRLARRALEQNDPAGALTLLDALDEAGGEAALLSGMAHLELDEYEVARAQLESAQTDPAARETAKLLLGVIALREGHYRAARLAFSDLRGAQDPTVRRTLRALHPLSSARTAISLSAALIAGYDSNLTLIPDGTPEATLAADAGGHALLALSVQPFGPRGPYVLGSAQLGRQVRLRAFDSTAFFAQAGWRWALAELAYRFHHSAFERVPYVSSHAAVLAAQLTQGAFDGWAEAAVISEQFHAPILERYAGVGQTADVGGRWRASRVWLHARYGVRHDGAGDPWLSALEHGPRLGVTVFPASLLRLGVELSASHRAWLAEDPALGARRDDLILGALFSGEVQLLRDLSWVGTFQAFQSHSNFAAFRYHRWSVSTGLRLSVGLL